MAKSMFGQFETREQLIDEFERTSARATGTIVGIDGNRAMVELELRALADEPVLVHLTPLRQIRGLPGDREYTLFGQVIVSRRDGRWVTS